MTDPATRIHLSTAFDLQKSPIHLGGASVVLFDLDAAAAHGDALYTRAELDEIAAVSSPKRKREKRAGKLAAKVLAREILIEEGADDCSLQEIEVLAAGHPVRVSVLDGLFFSISHTDGLVCAAAGPSSTGIDVERIRPLTPELAAEITDGSDPLFVFTRKEAVLKAAGIGIGLGLDSVRLTEDGTEAVHEGRRYRLTTVFSDKYVLSLASVDAEHEVRVSPGQEAIWFLHQLEDQGATYNLAYALELRGVLDTESLRGAIEGVVHRHEALRTSFPLGGGQCRGVVQPPARFELPEIDVAPAEVESHAQAFAATPIALDEAPLIRAQLLCVEPKRHVLVFAVHHIAFDAVSLNIFLTELAHGYEGATHALPALATREDRQGSLSFWKKALEGAPRVSSDSSPAGAVRWFELPESLTAWSQREDVTLFVVLLAAFKALLVRWTGETDVVVGVPFQGRTAPGADALIGYFVNTLPVRTRVSGEYSFPELLASVRDTVYDAFEHQDVPVAKLVQEMGSGEGAGTMPLFRVVAQAIHAGTGSRDAAPPMELPQLECTCRQVDSGSVPFDLVLTLNRSRGGSLAKFEYRTDQFDEATIERMIGHLRVFLDGALADPDCPIATIPILTDTERTQLIEEFNDTKVEYPRDATVHELFERQAERTPDAVAVVMGDDTLTYGELNTRANRLAHYLRELGVGSSQPVACLLERSFDMVVSLLGVLKAGGAYLPLDPKDPAERIRFIRDDAKARVALVASCFDEIDFSEYSAANPAREQSATDLAYVTYTSGSTGRPKGVEIPHRAVNRLVFGVDYAPLRAGEVFLQIAPVAFDASTFELWGALLHGSKVVLYGAPEMDAHELERAVKKNGVTCLFLTTALFNTIVDDYPQALEGVRCVIFGGEQVSVPHVRRALERLPDTDFVHAYGPTEATTFTCCYRIPRDLAHDARTIPIGRPISNTRVFILDRRKEPVPVGCVGELHIAGDALARGYVGAEELTAERFITDPSSGDRMYRTGDLGRYLPGGEIEFVNRSDDQIKLRGFRVEPGEIEAAMSEHPDVGQCAVVVSGEGPRKALVIHMESSAASEELRSFLSGRLPAYMVPSQFVTYDTLPLTPNGKIDRAALESPPLPERAAPPPIARNEGFEVNLTRVWKDVLGVAHIGRDDDFFDLGGHSLLALSLSSQIEERFGIVLPLAKLFAAPTIAQLLPVIQERVDIGPISVLQEGGPEHPLFLSPGGGGHSFHLRAIARRLGTEQACYGLQYPGVDGKQRPCTRVGAIAAALIEEIQSVQPSGPYFIGGYSLGCMVAHEIARQLAESGETVALLALLDPTDLHGYRSNQVARNLKTLRRRWSSFRRRLRSQRKDQPKESTIARHIERVGLAARHAEMSFSPGHFPGRAVLLKTGLPATNEFWVKRWCDEVEEVPIPGGHHDVTLSPNVEVVAEQMLAALRRARAESAAATRGTARRIGNDCS